MSRTSARNYAVLYFGGSKGGSSSAAGGNVILSAGAHKLDGIEHIIPDDDVSFDASIDAHGLLPKLSGVAAEIFHGDGTWGPAIAALGWYNVKTDGTCVGDGTTDDTVALQAAITAATASGTQSATLYFPPGVYLIGGALQDTGARNGQILLPNVSTSSATITIRFVGAISPAQQAWGPIPGIGSGESVIKSTLTGGSGTASVISGGTLAGAANRNNITVDVENLTCLAPDNPSLTFWSLISTQDGRRKNLRIIGGGSIIQPTHTNAYGIKLPGVDNANYTDEDSIEVIGYYTGILTGELSRLIAIIGYCIVGIECPGFNNVTTIVQFVHAGCQIGIKVTGTTYLDVQLYDPEHQTSPSWAVTTYDLYDPSNLAYGHISWWGTAVGGSPDHSFVVNGGANVWATEVIKLAPPSGVTPATYGDATHVAQVAVDVYGRITSASAVSISAGAAALDDLTDVTLTTPATRDRLRFDGSVWRNSALIWAPVMVLDPGTGNYLVLTDVSGNPIMAEV